MEIFGIAESVGSEKLIDAIEELLDMFEIIPYDTEAEKNYIQIS